MGGMTMSDIALAPKPAPTLESLGFKTEPELPSNKWEGQLSILAGPPKSRNSDFPDLGGPANIDNCPSHLFDGNSGSVLNPSDSNVGAGFGANAISLIVIPPMFCQMICVY